jgi:hypothetical protein
VDWRAYQEPNSACPGVFPGRALFTPCGTLTVDLVANQLLAYRLTASGPSGASPNKGEQPLNGNEFPERFSPDGLTEQMIDVLLREVDVAGTGRPRPSSALMGETAAQRRYRGRARRPVAAVVWALPARGTTGGPGGWAA